MNGPSLGNMEIPTSPLEDSGHVCAHVVVMDCTFNANNSRGPEEQPWTMPISIGQHGHCAVRPIHRNMMYVEELLPRHGALEACFVHGRGPQGQVKATELS